MSFQKRRVTKTPKRAYKKRAYSKSNTAKKSKKRLFFWKTILWFFLFFLVLFLLGTLILYKKYIQPLPAISELENLEIAEASIIYDRDGNELYKVFEEKRTYKNYSDINENMVNALVAWEDKRYWENPGIDFIGLTRAVLYRVIGKSDKIEWTSTLTQQLIRNMIITNERTAERKIKEMYLAYKLTNNLSKEKIIELYLNKISFWSNAFGIEQAAQTFFGKKASELSVLESSMLASLPKWPTYYSPYNNYDRLVGYPYTYKWEDSENTIDLITEQSIEENKVNVDKIKDFIAWWKLKRYSESKALICGLDKEKLKAFISVDRDGCSVTDYSDLLILLNGIKISDEETTIEYQTGRKDFILGRMLEDNYIDFEQYREALLTSIGFNFETYSEVIKYPHFVFYVREYLEQKYWKEIVERGGLKIYTSIDPELQDKAEEIVQKQAESNETKFGAQNAALVSIDNETGQILAMVWWRDYFDEENKGNINMTTAELQPGSTFKPFVYSMAIDQEIIGTKTPIYDVRTVFPGWYAPNNFDWKFQGKMTVAEALNQSRNIPAVKMFFLAWWEEKIINWMEKLWVETIRRFKDEYNANNDEVYSYWASMALWTAMMSPLELARAYSVYANMWYLKDLVPVLKIYDSKWLLIEEFVEDSNVWEEVIDSATAYITNNILSDTGARPAYWNNFLSLSGRKAAAKTWTSTKQFQRWGQKIIYPRNLWTVWYTPQVTTVVWSGNNNWAETNFKWNGLEASGPIWKQFMEFYHKGQWALDWRRPGWVKEVNISKLSGLLAPEGLSPDLVARSLFVNTPKEYDSANNTVQVDLLCNWIVDDATPASAIGNVQLLRLRSLKPSNAAWENPVQAWLRESEFADIVWATGNYITSVSQEVCERRGFASEIEVGANIENGDDLIVWSNYIELWYRSNMPLVRLDIFLGNEKISSISIDNEDQWIYAGNLTIPKGSTGEQVLKIQAVDDEYYSAEKSYAVNILADDTVSPIVIISNPSDTNISLNSGDSFNLRWTISDASSLRSTNIYIDWSPYKIGLEGREFTQEISSEWLSGWTHIIKVESIDMSFNKWYTEIELSIIGAPAEEDTDEDSDLIWEEPEI